MAAENLSCTTGAIEQDDWKDLQSFKDEKWLPKVTLQATTLKFMQERRWITEEEANNELVRIAASTKRKTEDTTEPAEEVKKKLVKTWKE
eukprot:2044423-Amphidinium_carterae.1